jgi:hypothetical protein
VLLALALLQEATALFLTHFMTFLPQNLSLQEKKACVNRSILTQRTVHDVTTGYQAETGLNRPKNSDKLSVRHDFYPDKRQTGRCTRPPTASLVVPPRYASGGG